MSKDLQQGVEPSQPGSKRDADEAVNGEKRSPRNALQVQDRENKRISGSILQSPSGTRPWTGSRHAMTVFNDVS